MTNRVDSQFDSHGTTCRAWHFPAENDALANVDGAPCVVLAHGFGGTRDAGLQPYAEAFSAAGMHALVFDYRHFGASDGDPRQLLSVPRQLQDWQCAIEHARSLDGVDGNRIALWGSSFSGGHVIAAAVADGRIAAITSQGPMHDGLPTVLNIINYAGIGQVAKLTWHGLRDWARAATGQTPHDIPLVAAPGELGAMTTPDSEPGYHAITPAGWRNAFSARAALTLGLYRPGLKADKLPCPILIQVCTKDAICPPASAYDTAKRAGSLAEVREYELGHFDIYVGQGFQDSSRDQVEFLTRHLSG